MVSIWKEEKAGNAVFDIKLAGVVLQIDNLFEQIRQQCEPYLTTEKPIQLQVRVTQQELEEEKRQQNGCYGEAAFSDAYLETVCAYRQIAYKLVKQRVLLLHGSAVALDGRGYVFLGRSGMGKTTQTRLWLQYFGSRVKVINGDKPLLRFEPPDKGAQRIIACGTPWNGKEGYGCPEEVPLEALFFLRQSVTPSARILSQEEALEALVHQLLQPKELELLEPYFEMVQSLLERLTCYELACDQTVASVKLAESLIKN